MLKKRNQTVVDNTIALCIKNGNKCITMLHVMIKKIKYNELYMFNEF